jgi:hypothetical protein
MLTVQDLTDPNKIAVINAVNNGTVSATHPASITVTITRTFTPTDDPFGLYSLLEAAGNLDNAEAEMRWGVLLVDDPERRANAADALLDDATWVIITEEMKG